MAWPCLEAAPFEDPLDLDRSAFPFDWLLPLDLLAPLADFTDLEADLPLPDCPAFFDCSCLDDAPDFSTWAAAAPLDWPLLFEPPFAPLEADLPLEADAYPFDAPALDADFLPLDDPALDADFLPLDDPALEAEASG